LTYRLTLYCTFAVIVAFPFSAKAQLLVFFPPLEHPPDQMASRPLETDSVILVPEVNPACIELPTATLIPAGLDVTRSPLRPVAVTVSVAVVTGGALGFTVSVAKLVKPPADAKIVRPVVVVTVPTGIGKKGVLVCPCGTVTLAGTVAMGLLLDSVTVKPPAGAGPVRLTSPCVTSPPVTTFGKRFKPASVAAGGMVKIVSVPELDDLL
jgi:hypothetical protein